MNRDSPQAARASHSHIPSRPLIRRLSLLVYLRQRLLYIAHAPNNEFCVVRGGVIRSYRGFSRGIRPSRCDPLVPAAASLKPCSTLEAPVSKSGVDKTLVPASAFALTAHQSNSLLTPAGIIANSVPPPRVSEKVPLQFRGGNDLLWNRLKRTESRERR
ncbi:hypothetical protein F2P81_012348 [Scophthalmus maximus]|uniref:Uncharacterized protein n=1 Tax=Scophthalmus maximus TaxID=52904 RepID=A0A6A4SRQ5_SCOMX|nr:hypothetical protein F2P81_012348 [Scophthalmus maximus]